MNSKYLADLRRDYSAKQLSEDTVAHDPFIQFEKWFDEALGSEIVDVNGMTLSTVDSGGRPLSRVVLLKSYDPSGFVFFTNYGSRKASDISVHPHVCLHFYWSELERQIVISGEAVKVSRQESEEYFATRPRESQIGAWASHQSERLTDREELEKRIGDLTQKFEGQEVPCPPNWGGYRVAPDRIEFWQGRPSRLHDRIVYELADASWQIGRLSP